MCEFMDKLSRNTGEFANKVGQVFAYAQGYDYRFRDVTQGTIYEQSRLRFNVLRAESLKQTM